MDSKTLAWLVVPLIVWLGLFAYLLVIDRKLARIEAEKEQDDL